jgi:hypothetical protein
MIEFFTCGWTRRVASRVALLVSALSCGARVEGQPQESNTNWLKSCDANEQCGDGMACECGVCTRGCSELACPARLSCVEHDVCPGTVASCQATCASDSDCDQLARNLHCTQGVCADDVGLTTSQVSMDPNPQGTIEPDAGDGVICRYAYVDYPAGAQVVRETCNNTSCTCGNEGQWVDCVGTNSACTWTGGNVRACSEMFPGIPLNALPSDPVDIGSAFISGTDLVMSVSYGGGCEQHDHVVCFAPGGESDPVWVELKLIHDAHGDSCEALLSTELRFDLAPVVAAHQASYSVDADIIRTSFGVLGYGELACEQRVTASQIEVSNVPVDGASCEQDSDCIIANNDTACQARCGVVTSKTQATELEARIEVINAGFCASYEQDCGPVIIPPCDPPSEPYCEDGRCVQAGLGLP